jgi:hypothetical protein
MKGAEQARGVPLSGLGVKVTNNFFLIGLSSTEQEMKRNTELLRDRGWFDVPIIYTNGRRAILALEKGTPGERVFAEAFTAWLEEQAPPPISGIQLPSGVIPPTVKDTREDLAKRIENAARGARDAIARSKLAPAPEQNPSQ